MDHRVGHAFVNRLAFWRVLIEPGAEVVRRGARRIALLDRVEEPVRFLSQLGHVLLLRAGRWIRQVRIQDRQAMAEALRVQLPGFLLVLLCFVVVLADKIDDESAEVVGCIVGVVLVQFLGVQLANAHRGRHLFSQAWLRLDSVFA